MRPIAERLDRLEQSRLDVQSGTQHQQQHQPPAADDPFGALRDDDYLEAGQARRALQQYQQRIEGLTQGLQTVYGMGTAQLENFSRLQHPKEWEKYGDEIGKLIEQRKAQKIITPDDYKEAIDIVKGRHYSDYVDARAQEMLNSAPTTEGVGTATGTNMNEPNRYEVPDNYRAVLDRAGLKLKDVEDMIARRRARGDNITVEKWLEMAANDDIVYDGDKYITRDLTTKKAKQSGA